MGARPEYRRGRVTYNGLVSAEAPILKLFVTKLPRARHLRSGQHKAESSCTDSKLLSCDCPYIETSKSMRGALRVELDRNFTAWEALRSAIATCDVPQPNIVVGYQDPHGRVWRPHLIWLLADSVCFVGKGTRKPQSAWASTLRGLTAKLVPIGADPGGVSNPHRHKNPLSPLWDRRVFADEPYALDAERRDGRVVHAALRPFMPPREVAGDTLRQAAEASAEGKYVADHPDPVVSSESNANFRRLAEFAREQVTSHRDQQCGTWDAYHALVAEEALSIVGRGTRAEKAALVQARAIARWTWTTFRQKHTAQPLPAAARKERLAAGAKEAAKSKTAGTLNDIVAVLRGRSTSHAMPTQARVAAIVGKSIRTVKRHWSAAISMVAEGDISPPIDKKSTASSAAHRHLSQRTGSTLR